jgi:hypothetical protein
MNATIALQQRNGVSHAVGIEICFKQGQSAVADKYIRGLNLAVVKVTTVQATKPPL